VTHKTPATILLWIVALLTLAASTGCSKASARKSKLNDQQKWALAASAIPKKANDMELDIMGGGEPDADYVKTLLEMLKSDWEVTDRASALNAIKSLREQGHRADFNLMLKHVSKLDDNGFTRFLIRTHGSQNSAISSSWCTPTKTASATKALSPGITAA